MEIEMHGHEWNLKRMEMANMMYRTTYRFVHLRPRSTDGWDEASIIHWHGGGPQPLWWFSEQVPILFHPAAISEAIESHISSWAANKNCRDAPQLRSDPKGAMRCYREVRGAAVQPGSRKDEKGKQLLVASMGRHVRNEGIQELLQYCTIQIGGFLKHGYPQSSSIYSGIFPEKHL